MDDNYCSMRIAISIITLVLFSSACSDSNTTPPQHLTSRDASVSAESTAEMARDVTEAEPEKYDDILLVIRDVATLPTQRNSGARITSLAFVNHQPEMIYAVDLDGYVYRINNETLDPEPFLDVQAALGNRFIHNDIEKGLTAFAFHPDFAQQGAQGFGKMYTATSESRDSGIASFDSVNTGKPMSHFDVIREWQVDPTSPETKAIKSNRVVMRIPHPFRDHTIGQIAFNDSAPPGSDDYGKLYIGVGDGGNTYPESGEINAYRTAQNPHLPLGKILRIDPLAYGSQPYTVPADNPFIGQPNFLPEIWAYGLRNPQRFTWDTKGDHRMLLIDIGQALAEEVNVGIAGSNYGWSEREGFYNVMRTNQSQFEALPANDDELNFTYPSLQYEHDLGRAITGGFIYRGALIPQLNGMYIFGDMASGRIFYTKASALSNGTKARFGEIKLKYNARQRTLLEIQNDTNHARLRFGKDASGELYLLTRNDGTIRKIVMASR